MAKKEHKATPIKEELAVQDEKQTSKWLAEPDKSPVLARKIYNYRSILVVLLTVVGLAVSLVSIGLSIYVRYAGGDVEWDGRLFEYAGRNIAFTQADGQETYPLSFDGTTYVPLDSFCSTLGLDISVDPRTDKVVITKEYKGTKGLEDLDRNTEKTASSYFIAEHKNLASITVGTDATGKKRDFPIENNALVLVWDDEKNLDPKKDSQRLEFDVSGWDWVTFNLVSAGTNEVVVYVDGQEAMIIPCEDGRVIQNNSLVFTGASRIAFGVTRNDRSRYEHTGSVALYDVTVGRTDWTNNLDS